MSRPLIDLTGRAFGRLTVIERFGAEAPVKWRCRCACGKETTSFGTNLKDGTARSCGCLRDELVRARATKHGQHQTPEYEAWSQAKYRCYNSQHHAYSNYGGRGIRMCERWLASFPNFLADMGPRPSARHTLDRINNDGDYEPGNCRWTTYGEQLRNTRQNRMVRFQGRRLCLMDWSKELGIHYETLRGRLNRWGSVERAFTAPVQN